jgi:hypothetical protein
LSVITGRFRALQLTVPPVNIGAFSVQCSNAVPPVRFEIAALFHDLKPDERCVDEYDA